MCILVFSVNPSSKYKFIIAFNRDENTERPTTTAHYWEDAPDILAGKDLMAKGTWFGINRKTGHFCCLTNFRQPQTTKAKVSRGQIVTEYLQIHENFDRFKSEVEWEDYIQNPDLETNPFNILYGNLNQDSCSIKYFSPRCPLGRVEITSGKASFSNGTLDSKWYKTEKLQRNFTRFMEQNSLDQDEPSLICSRLIEEVLSDASRSPLLRIPKTGCSYLKQLSLSSIFLEKKNNYGTRTSTVLMVDRENEVTYFERTHHHEPDRSMFMRMLFPRFRAKGKEDQIFKFKLGA